MEKRTHQPFEDWLLSEASLNSEETLALQEHLKTCEACLRLSTAWREAETQLRAAPMFTPAPGFTLRWQARLEADRLKMQRRQTLWILLFSVGGAALLFAVLGILLLPLIESPMPVLVALFYRLTALFASTRSTLEVVSSLFQTLFGVVPVTLWVGIAVALGGLSALWIVALRQLTSSRRITS